MSPVCQLEMTLPRGFPGGVWGDVRGTLSHRGVKQVCQWEERNDVPQGPSGLGGCPNTACYSLYARTCARKGCNMHLGSPLRGNGNGGNTVSRKRAPSSRSTRTGSRVRCVPQRSLRSRAARRPLGSTRRRGRETARSCDPAADCCRHGKSGRLRSRIGRRRALRSPNWQYGQRKRSCAGPP